jgi:triacylglycerol esterase/lipase EstA (alpha/beta hydrolase family)
VWVAVVAGGVAVCAIVAVALALTLSRTSTPTSTTPAASGATAHASSPSSSPRVSPSPSDSPSAPSGLMSSPDAVPPRPIDGQPGPVILVPGYGGDAAMLDPLAALLRKAGRTAITLALPDNAMGDLRGQAQVLAAEVTRQLRQGAASVDLVGYSAGGIVVALYVQSDPSHVRRVVALGAPLHGTQVAGLAMDLAASACPTACQQMAPGSSLLASIDDASPSRTGVPWLSMWTAHDEVVLPPDSARLPGAQNIELQKICADDAAGHTLLPSDPLAEGPTLRALEAAALPLPGLSPSDCTALRSLAGAR